MNTGRERDRRRMAAAWAVHLYTASGAAWAWLALVAAVQGRLREAFFWLAVQVVVDSTDGFLARLARVKEVLPEVDGSRLDDIVDYLTYVFVPAVLVTSVPIVPGVLGGVVAVAMLTASALRFSHASAKTADHFFTGFPSYWNVVVFYLVAFGWGPTASAVMLIALAVMVFVPIRYVYPSRTPVLRPLTIVLGLLWGGLMVAALFTFPETPRGILEASLLFPAYYVGLSLALDRQRRLVARRQP